MIALKEALVNYNLAQLEALAARRGLNKPAGHNREALAAFAADLLSPLSLAIAQEALTAAEKEALQTLASQGGFVETPKFLRRFGSPRSMGQARLLREKPWETPENVTESLLYLGFIFRGFRQTPRVPVEVIYIPTDLQPIFAAEAHTPAPFKVSLAKTPLHQFDPIPTAREDLFVLLSYLQTRLVRLNSEDQLNETDRAAIVADFYNTSPLTAAASPERAQGFWFDFMLHLARRMDFLRKQGRRLKLHAGAVRQWLAQPTPVQLRHLQQTWRTDPSWNDLWHVADLYPRPTGWENSPLRGRAKVIDYLSRLPTGEWIEIGSFIAAIKQTEPDFQRPTGDYQRWYIYNAAGDPLMGFEHWDDVEGVYLRHLLLVPLFGLGIISLGSNQADQRPTAFKITPSGVDFLHPARAAADPAPSKAAPLRIHPTEFTVKVKSTVSLLDRFQLARFASLQKREPDGVIYHINRQSYRLALEQSITAEQVLNLLNRLTNAQTPLALMEAIRNWDRNLNAVKLEQLTVLRVADPALLPELMQHPQIGQLLGSQVGVDAVLVPVRHQKSLEKLLQRLGYLAE